MLFLCQFQTTACLALYVAFPPWWRAVYSLFSSDTSHKIDLIIAEMKPTGSTAGRALKVFEHIFKACNVVSMEFMKKQRLATARGTAYIENFRVSVTIRPRCCKWDICRGTVDLKTRTCNSRYPAVNNIQYTIKALELLRWCGPFLHVCV